ncbi:MULTISPECIES: YkvA family protein [Clostridium]|uniref:DUF1232 domain-containing protein n=1 Tax=Clostridium beijerinckii TaxID=1520 RepID=A0A1S9N6R4_CLOBE|nr:MULTISPECIES: DUF1232 domain-containing protein [Clostridium]MBN7575021.1 DUF1232 domain-containing protein [Clostridium beijerinckii]MBN7577790.1 DUF1232 domain-containing protein [Clostridium beijerinckii]MBN7584784.1 DUF1232 domain-containing protein [Clostridium beijerinckii]MBO0518773.1 DUF1232 domain-containing protein [Clostridium beijerinckii]OOP73267.1 hypothetical protein CBEIBR21_09560 [Clostridium beijerinckii]
MGIKDRARKLKLDIPAVYIALKKKETSVIAKVFTMITIIYALSPIDLIPDFIPVIGLLDDIILLPILIAITIKFIPEEILSQCRIEAENLWIGGKPKRWYFAIPILLVWIVLIFLALKLL